MRDGYNFPLTFRGPAVDSGEIAVEDYAPALIALNKLVGIDGQDPETVAAEWLTAIGVVSE